VGGKKGWYFAIYKCSTDKYDEEDWFFPGSRCVDGTVEGALEAGISDAERALIREKIEEIIRENETPDVSGDGCCYYIISEKVVDWCMAHPTPIQHQKDDGLQR